MNPTNYKIEKGVSIPKKGRRGYNNFPFEEMEIGDSFFVPLTEGKKITSLQAQLHSNGISYVVRNNKTWKFKTAKDTNGVRIWRVK